MTDSVGFSHNFNPVNGTCHDAKDHEDNISLVDDLIFNNKLVTYIRKENELYRDNTIIENNITFSSSFNPLIANESTETEKSLSSEIANSVLVDSRLKEYTLAEISQIQLEFNQTMYGKRTFHIAWTAYVFSLTIFGGLLIFAVNDLSFIDCWFSATSATVNGGLTVKGPDDLTKPTFAILAFLMFFGSSAVMLLPTLLFRCHQLRALRPAMEARLLDRSLCPEDREVILDHILWYQASVCTSVIIATYILFWIFFGTVFLYLSMCSQERTAQLSRRGISNFQDALYLSLSAFTNSGLSLTDNLVYLSNNHGALATLSLLILAGNTLMPVLLRFCIKKIYQLTNTSFTINVLGHERCGLLRACLAYVLKSPRKICTYIFLGHDTSYLLQFALVSTAVEYFIFIVSTLHRRDLQGVYGDRSDLARLGIFQVINTRHAGFGLIDFRLLSQELIFVTAVMMFLSPVPYIGLLQKTTGKSHTIFKYNHVLHQVYMCLCVHVCCHGIVSFMMLCLVFVLSNKYSMHGVLCSDV